ncbi:MAG: chorismate lyase [Gammaproteobacteria bacterium]|nr:chorismate lyase [Gammaproteobacteria bacterium]
MKRDGSGLAAVTTIKRFRRQIPEQWNPWLLDASSLTRRLQGHCCGRFQVKIVSEQLQRPTVEEAMRLSVSPARLALVRQVVLCCQGEPWVLAHSVVPLSSLKGELLRLKRLGEHPLGAFLFAHPQLQRSGFELFSVAMAVVSDRFQLESVGDRFAAEAPLWGRRSRFCIGDKSLLVSEIFLPGLQDHDRSGCDDAAAIA